MLAVEYRVLGGFKQLFAYIWIRSIWKFNEFSAQVKFILDYYSFAGHDEFPKFNLFVLFGFPSTGLQRFNKIKYELLLQFWTKQKCINVQCAVCHFQCYTFPFLYTFQFNSDEILMLHFTIFI